MTQNLGPYLKAARRSSGFTLRQVEQLSEGRIGNGYLSQIESGHIQMPSTRVLHELATIYGIAYADILHKAGLPSVDAKPPSGVIAGIPSAALNDLSEVEAAQVMNYVAFLKAQRSTS